MKLSEVFSSQDCVQRVAQVGQIIDKDDVYQYLAGLDADGNERPFYEMSELRNGQRSIIFNMDTIREYSPDFASDLCEMEIAGVSFDEPQISFIFSQGKSGYFVPEAVDADGIVLSDVQIDDDGRFSDLISCMNNMGDTSRDVFYWKNEGEDPEWRGRDYPDVVLMASAQHTDRLINANESIRTKLGFSRDEWNDERFMSDFVDYVDAYNNSRYAMELGQHYESVGLNRSDERVARAYDRFEHNTKIMERIAVESPEVVASVAERASQLSGGEDVTMTANVWIDSIHERRDAFQEYRGHAPSISVKFMDAVKARVNKVKSYVTDKFNEFKDTHPEFIEKAIEAKERVVDKAYGVAENVTSKVAFKLRDIDMSRDDNKYSEAAATAVKVASKARGAYRRRGYERNFPMNEGGQFTASRPAREGEMTHTTPSDDELAAVGITVDDIKSGGDLDEVKAKVSEKASSMRDSLHNTYETTLKNSQVFSGDTIHRETVNADNLSAPDPDTMVYPADYDFS